MATKLDARLQRLEAQVKAKAAVQVEAERPLTEAEFRALIVWHIRDNGLQHDKTRWVAHRGYYTEHDCAIIADVLNRWVEANPGSVFVPLYENEFDAALEALDANRFAFSRTDYLQYHWVNMNCKTGTPLLTNNGWRNTEVHELASNVQNAAWFVHCQNGAAQPETLEEFADWLRTWQPYALPAELEIERETT